MTNDGYLSFANSSFGGWMTGALGLPRPLPLQRRADVGAGVRGPILMGPDGGDRFTSLLCELARADSVEIHREAVEGARYGALVFNASDCIDGRSSRRLYDFFHGSLRRLSAQGRIIVLARPIEELADVEGAAIQRGLEGFVRSLAKEAGRGATTQLIRVEAGAETLAAGTLAFFLSSRSAYVSGQVVEVRKVEVASPAVGHQGRKVLVTGAARGIGEAIARLFAAEGAKVIALDTAHGEEALRRLSAEIGADPLVLDITTPDAASLVAADASARGGYDVVVHNAGITRDKTLARMESGWWDAVMAVNLTAPLALTRALLDRGLINSGGRVIAVSSLSGIAGNRGQSNYALSKAAWIGAVRRLSVETSGRITVNAVAPGFIETEMTAAIPFAIREAGRRMNSLGQGGRPVDVAETIAWLAEPSSAGVNGQVVRVCGQSLLGA
jgi:3-oxoacyl-[acyl-carrier protein] reductase